MNTRMSAKTIIDISIFATNHSTYMKTPDRTTGEAKKTIKITEKKQSPHRENHFQESGNCLMTSARRVAR